MNKRLGALAGGLALAAVTVLVPTSADARGPYQWGNRDAGCEESVDDFEALPAVQPNGKVENVLPLRVKVGTGTSTQFGDEERARVTQEATWSGLDDSVDVEKQVTWYLSKDGGKTFESITGDLGDNYVPCPRDAGGRLYAATEGYAVDELDVVVARAISNPIEIRPVQLKLSGDPYLSTSPYPGPVVDRAGRLVAGLQEIGTGEFQPATTQRNVWTIGGTVVSRSATYTPTSSTWGKTLSVKSTISAPFTLPVSAQASGVVKRAPSMSNTTTVLGGGKVRIDVKVVVVGTSRPAGSVRIQEDGGDVATIPVLSNGTGSVTLTGRTPGVHMYAAKYSGNSLVYAANRYRTVTMK